MLPAVPVFLFLRVGLRIAPQIYTIPSKILYFVAMHQLLSYLRLFKNIPERDGETITGFFESRMYKEGDVLHKGGTSCREMFFITQGILRIASITDKGIEKTHYFYRENQFCTILPGFMDGTTAEGGIVAACDVAVLAISRERLQDLFTAAPYMKAVIDQLNQQRLLEKIHTRNTYIGEDAATQYKLFVLHQPDIALRVPVKDIASYLGITPQSLSRIRKQMRY